MNQINVDPISYVWLYILMSFKNIQVIIIFWTAEDTTQGQNNTHNNTGTKIHSEKLFHDSSNRQDPKSCWQTTLF